MNLEELGWNKFFAAEYKNLVKNNQFEIARVAVQYKNIYKLFSVNGELLGEITGKMRFDQRFPAVGDWVLYSPQPEDKAIIHHILKRKSKFSRMSAGTNIGEQVVAANIDIVFIVSSLNQDFNLRRLERYLTMAWESGAKPVIILSKADLCNDLEQKKREVESIAAGVAIQAVSAVNNYGIKDLTKYLSKGKTAALLGSSGVGKSTLINKLMGRDILKTAQIREDDDKGRHTTTNREMFLLKDRGIIIDTPGMRELQLWNDKQGLEGSFADIVELAQGCRFNDCRHKTEPGCAVKDAIKTGRLSEERLKNYEKLQRELKYQELREKRGSNAVEKYKMKLLFED